MTPDSAHGFIMLTALYYVEQFRQPVIAEVQCSLGEDLDGRLPVFVQAHAMCDQRVVVRPEPASVVAEWIEYGFFLR